jgi:hypothetical protein
MDNLAEKFIISVNGKDSRSRESFDVYDARQIILGMTKGYLGLIAFIADGNRLLTRKQLVNISRIPENNIRVLESEEVGLLTHINPAHWGLVIYALEHKFDRPVEDFRSSRHARQDWRKAVSRQNPDFSKGWSVIDSER